MARVSVRRTWRERAIASLLFVTLTPFAAGPVSAHTPGKDDDKAELAQSPAGERHRNELDQGDRGDDHDPGDEGEFDAETLPHQHGGRDREPDGGGSEAQDGSAPRRPGEQPAALARQRSELGNQPKMQ